jgi:hypothetical protein
MSCSKLGSTRRSTVLSKPTHSYMNYGSFTLVMLFWWKHRWQWQSVFFPWPLCQGKKALRRRKFYNICPRWDSKTGPGLRPTPAPKKSWTRGGKFFSPSDGNKSPRWWCWKTFLFNWEGCLSLNCIYNGKVTTTIIGKHFFLTEIFVCFHKMCLQP